MTNKITTNRPDRRAFALVLVIGLIALITPIVGSLSLFAATDGRALRLEATTLQHELATQSLAKLIDQLSENDAPALTHEEQAWRRLQLDVGSCTAVAYIPQNTSRAVQVSGRDAVDLKSRMTALAEKHDLSPEAIDPRPVLHADYMDLPAVLVLEQLVMPYGLEELYRWHEVEPADVEHRRGLAQKPVWSELIAMPGRSHYFDAVTAIGTDVRRWRVYRTGESSEQSFVVEAIR